MSSPSGVAPEDSWKTKEIREAESDLDRSLAKSRDLLKEIDKVQIPPANLTSSPEQQEALKAAASKPDAPAELRLVKRKVDAGELSWKDVAEGRAFADPDVRRLAGAKLGGDARETFKAFQEGATLDEVIEARSGGATGDPLSGPLTTPSQDAPPATHREPPPPPSPPTPPPPPPAPPARPRPVADEDYYADPLADEEPAPPPPSRPAPPGRPAPEQPRRAPRRSESSPVDDDDYFSGGDHLRG